MSETTDNPCQARRACSMTEPNQGRYRMPSNDGKTYWFCRECLKELERVAKKRGHGGFSVKVAIARARLMAGDPE